MSNKKISELTLSTPELSSIAPATNSSGTATNKITMQSILDLENRWDLFKPTAPTNVSGVAGDSSVSLTWTASDSISVAPITDYSIQYSSNSGVSWTSYSDTASTATSGNVTGLTNSTNYVFRVAGVNIVGQGAYSSESLTLTPIGPTTTTTTTAAPTTTTTTEAPTSNPTSNPTSIIVSGAGVYWLNGTYNYTGDDGGGRPIYEKSDDSYKHIRYGHYWSQWAIEDDSDPYYTNASDSMTVPASGWNYYPGTSSLPVPTFTFVW